MFGEKMNEKLFIDLLSQRTEQLALDNFLGQPMNSIHLQMIVSIYAKE
jgi:hypothetical protein